MASTTASASHATQDECLVETAREAGADVRERCAVENVVWRGGRAVGVVYKDSDAGEREIHAKLVIGADGRKSHGQGAQHR